jgi:hypothetical protein
MTHQRLSADRVSLTRSSRTRPGPAGSPAAWCRATGPQPRTRYRTRSWRRCRDRRRAGGRCAGGCVRCWPTSAGAACRATGAARPVSERSRRPRSPERRPHPRNWRRRSRRGGCWPVSCWRLPEPFRETLVLRCYQDHSAADVARLLDVPAGTVRWRLKEGLARLRERLDQARGGRAAWRAALAPIAAPGARRP